MTAVIGKNIKIVCSMKEPFLHFLAKEYVKRNDLSEYCFVFPNRRSGKFFAKELEDCATKALLTPEITTINNFVSELTDAVEANRIESLVMLYKAYKSVDPESNVTFDAFARWGDVLLNDFGDVDRYMVDAKDLFFNISDLKALKANYLTDEVKEILSHFFNMRYTPNDDDERFWQHIATENGEIKIKEGFKTIWLLLYPIYKEYLRILSECGLTYSGKMYRDAVAVAKNRKAEEFDSQKYVFVGFNVLSKSEYELFSAMKSMGIAEFHWDYNSPAFKMQNNKGTKFLSNYIKEFKPPFEDSENTDMPSNLYAIGIPSNYGQTRYADAIVRELVAKGVTDKSNAIDTAIVLPDEHLFMPMVKAIGENSVDSINVTMGLTIRNSSIATLMAALSRMHYQAKMVKGVWVYFHADVVKDVLLHPIVKFRNQTQSLALINRINATNCYQVTYEMIEECAPDLASLFVMVKDLTAKEVYQYIDNVLKFSEYVLKCQQKIDKSLLEKGDDNDLNVASIELSFLKCYCEALEQLKSVLQNASLYAVGEKMDINTFCFLLDRLIGGTKVAFEGEPLGGLQIMGLLETRCLDFKNLIILSMNERIFPRKHFTKSFIPQKLRKAYGMSTIEHQESMYAYYFYRLISRADNVFMLYDSRTQGANSGEESRFINQLSRLFRGKCYVHRVMPGLGINAPKNYPVIVEKDDRLMQILDLFKVPMSENVEDREKLVRSGGLKMLSAHSMNVYIDCPMRFYLHYVEGLAEIDDVSEFMEASTFGTIVHETIQQLYRDDSLITEDYIDNLLDAKNKMIENTIIANVNRIFLRKGEKCYEPLFGESKLKYDVIKVFIERILLHDKKYISENAPIHYIQGEKNMVCQLPIGDMKVNFTYIIDRLDEVEEDGKKNLRIIDYKTGKDNTSFSKLENLFDENQKERRHAILQLMLYCKALSLDKNYADRKMQPLIYKLRNMNETGVFFAENNKKKYQLEYPVMENDTSENINASFYEELSRKLSELFDKNIPFRQTTNEENCKYCKFKDFCRKE